MAYGTFFDVRDGSPSTHAVFVPEVWSVSSIIQTEQALVLGRLVNRQFETEMGIGDIVHVQTVKQIAAQAKTEGSEIVPDTTAATDKTVTVDQWYYTAIGVESLEKVQANRDTLKIFAGKLVYGINEEIDNQLAAHPDGFQNTVGTLAQPLDYTDWLDAHQYLSDENVPPTDRFAVISPAEQTNLLQMEKVINNDYSSVHGDGKRLLGDEIAYFRSILNTPIYVSTNVEGTNAAGHDNVMMHRDAISLIMQEGITPHSQYDIQYLTQVVVMEAIFGSAIYRDSASDAGLGKFGVWMKGK